MLARSIAMPVAVVMSQLTNAQALIGPACAWDLKHGGALSASSCR